MGRSSKKLAERYHDVPHGQCDVLSPAQGKHSTLPVVAARIDALQRGVLENLYRELETSLQQFGKFLLTG